MNEYIVQIISATRLWLISRYRHHTLKKNMHCALFQEFVETIFKFSADLDVRNESTGKSGILLCHTETCVMLSYCVAAHV